MLLGLVPDECQLVVRGRPVVVVPGDAAAARGYWWSLVRGCSRGGADPPRARLACRRRASVSTPSPAVQRVPGRRWPGRYRAPREMAVGPAGPSSMSSTRTLVCRVVSFTAGGAGAAGASGAWAGILIVNTAPPPRLSSTVSTPRRNCSDSRAMGRPEPTPRMIWRWSGGRGREARLEGAVLVVDPGSVVGDADRLPVVEDGDHDVAEVRVQQILDELLEDRVGDLPALLAAVVVRLLRQRGDERGQVLLLDGDHPRRARERVVDGDARRPGPGRDVGERVVERLRRRGGSGGRGWPPRPRPAAAGCRAAAPSSASSLSRNDSMGAPSIAEPLPRRNAAVGRRETRFCRRNTGCYPQGVQDVWKRPPAPPPEHAQFAGVVESGVSAVGGRCRPTTRRGGLRLDPRRRPLGAMGCGMTKSPRNQPVSVTE